MKPYVLFFILIFCTTWTKAQNSPADYQKMAIESSKAWLDLDYVGDRHTGHRLDIHLPKNAPGPAPVVVAIYGSAWFSNSSKAHTYGSGLGQKLLENGFAVISINHRASSDALFPAQIQDVKAAIRFIRANGEAFGLDTSFVGITGWSSGGHLASLTGVTNGLDHFEYHGLEVDIEGSLGKFTGSSSKVDAVVDWFGPTDFLIMDECGSSFSHNEEKSPESSLIGGPIQDNPDKAAVANPITYVSQDTPPFLILHGDKDMLVPHCQSQKLYEKLQETGIESGFITVEEGGHGPGVMTDQYYERMIAFFRAQVKE